jgi:hypothetical protein
MKQVHRRQKLFVKPNQDVQKNVIEAGRIQKADAKHRRGSKGARRKHSKR